MVAVLSTLIDIQTTYNLQILPRDLFMCINIDELPRSALSGSKVDEV